MKGQDRPQGQEHWRTSPMAPIDRSSVHGSQMNSQPISAPSAPTYLPGRIQSPYPQPPPLPPARRNLAKVVALVALALIPVAVFLLVAAWLFNSHTTTTAGSEASTSEAIAAVCSPGTFGHPSQQDAPAFPGATDVAECTAKLSALPDAPVASERYGPIWIVEFASPGAARSEAGTESLLGATAIGTIGSKNVIFVAPGDSTGASVQPLAQFGFIIRPGR